MKLTKGKIYNSLKFRKINHLKYASEDFNNPSNRNNFFISNFFKQNKIKTLENENLPNLKTNIQNIFSNEDNKRKAIQYLIKLRKDRNSPSTDFKKILSSRQESESDIHKNKEINLYKFQNNENKKNKSIIKPIITSYDLSVNSFDFRPININKKKRNENDKNNIVKISSIFNNLISEDEDCDYNDISNNFNNGNKYSLISLNKNIFNNKRTFGYIPDNVNKKNKYSFNKIKNNKTFEEQIMINDETNDDNSDTQKLKRNSFINKNNSQNSYKNIIKHNTLMQKNPIYKKLNLKNVYRHKYKLNSNINKKIYLNSEREKINIFEDIYNHKDIKDIRVNLKKQEKNVNKKEQNFKREFNKNDLYEINSIQLSINKTNKKENNFSNNISFTSFKNNENNIFSNEYENNNNKFNINNLTLCNQVNINLNENKINDKLIFNKNEEIIEYIKKIYNNEKIKEIFLLEDKSKKQIENRLLGLMSLEEGNKIKEKNEELLNENNKLKYENRQYKKELIDIRNQFNDLSKEIIIIKEENEKLKDNIINNMIDDDNNDNINDESKNDLIE